jgi:hypothetical protein
MTTGSSRRQGTTVGLAGAVAYDGRVKTARTVLVVLYVAYLVQVGLLMLMLPWSDAWGVMLVRLPTILAAWLDSPAVKGIVSAFGFLHLALLGVELISTTPNDSIRAISNPK